jgi:hypothetical protein
VPDIMSLLELLPPTTKLYEVSTSKLKISVSALLPPIIIGNLIIFTG